MPTYVITDDTKSLCLAISGGETKNIDKDNAVVRVIPANTGLNTTAIDQLSIEHDGHFATRIPYNDVTVSGVSPSSVLDFRTKVLTILNNNSSGGGDMTAAVYDPAGYATQVTVRDIQTNVNAAQDLLGSSGSAITAGQGYIIDNGGVTQLPTGISLMRVVGIDLPSGVKGFSTNAQAYVTALSTWVPCTYDVGTNNVSGKVIVWSGDLSQTATSDPTIDRTNINLFASDPVITYSATGLYNMNFPTAIFSSANYARVSVIVDGANGFAFNTEYGGVTDILINAYKIGNAAQDDVLSNSYVEIVISL